MSLLPRSLSLRLALAFALVAVVLLGAIAAGAGAGAGDAAGAVLLGGLVASVVCYRVMLRIGALPEEKRVFA